MISACPLRATLSLRHRETLVPFRAQRGITFASKRLFSGLLPFKKQPTLPHFSAPFIFICIIGINNLLLTYQFKMFLFSLSCSFRRAFSVFKGHCIIPILWSFGLHEILPYGSSGYSVGVLLLRLVVVENPQVLLGHGGKWVNFVLIILNLYSYGTMFLNVKNAYKNSKERSHTINPWVSYDPTINKYCVQLKAYVRTAHMPYAKVRNFLTWSDFTILSSAK